MWVLLMRVDYPVVVVLMIHCGPGLRSWVAWKRGHIADGSRSLRKVERHWVFWSTPINGKVQSLEVVTEVHR